MNTPELRAFVRLHSFLLRTMKVLKEIEDDPAVPAKHHLKAKALRWDWEQIEPKKSNEETTKETKPTVERGPSV